VKQELIMSKLAGKVAVVTGASKGIGAGIARALGAEGAAVVVNYASDQAGAERVVTDINASGGQAIAVQANVAKPNEVKQLFEATRAAFGHLDVLVNNAGVFSFSPIEELDEDELHRQFETNVFGLLRVTKEASPLFGAEGGSIINIGSAVTSLAIPNSSTYAATKGAVDVITGVLAKELGPRKIRVNSINPGGVETEGFHATGFAGGDFERDMVAATPLGRLGQPDDIAKVAVFLASADSGWLTGDIILASGGQR
jgi:3-oxoacyl-[acyl-carrier protein] reductase